MIGPFTEAMGAALIVKLANIRDRAPGEAVLILIPRDIRKHDGAVVDTLGHGERGFLDSPPPPAVEPGGPQNDSWIGDTKDENNTEGSAFQEGQHDDDDLGAEGTFVVWYIGGAVSIEQLTAVYSE
jgi:hypothetical protein